MDTDQYQVVFDGTIAEGYTIEAVMANLAALYKTDLTKIKWMFAKERLVLKKHLDRRTTLNYLRAFEKAGMVCRAEKMVQASDPSPERPMTEPRTDDRPGLQHVRQSSMTGLVSLIIAALVLGVYLTKPGIPFFRTIADAPLDNLFFLLFLRFPSTFLSAAGILLCLFGTILGIAGLIELHRKRLLPVVGLILNICTATAVAWSMVGVVAQEMPGSSHQSIVIPDTSVATQKDFDRKKLAWMQRHTVAPFTARVADNVDWKPAARQFLTQICNHVTDQDASLTAVELQAKGKELIDRGCSDELVGLWYGRMCLLNKDYRDAHQWAAYALEKLKASPYPVIHTFYAAKTLTQVAAWNQDQSESTVHRWNRAGMLALAKAIASGHFESSETSIAFRLANETYEGQDMVDFRWIVEGNGDNDPWLLMMIQGASEVEAAWRDRGNGWARKVTPEGWKGFRLHLDKANKLLRQAWHLNPDRPEAAGLMITVTMGGRADPGETESKWFNRSVAAQIDYHPAYISMLWALEPRWGGSLDQMERFGQRCLLSGRFDTDIPLFYLKALRDIAGLQDQDGWRNVFRRPDVQECLTVMFNGFTEEPSRKRDVPRFRIQQGLTQAWAGNYARAEAVLNTHLDQVRLTNGFWGKALSWGSRPRDVIEAELRAFNGPHGPNLKTAEEMLAGRRDGEATGLFEEVMLEHGTDQAVHDYLRDRIALIRMGDPQFTAFPPLYYAARENRIEVARFLIANGANVNARTNHGDTALHIAAYKGHQEVVKLLLEAGADVNAKNNKNKLPLHDALGEEFDRIAAMLVAAGSEVNVVSLDGWSPLHLAVRYNQPELAVDLIQRGAAVDVPNQQHWTPLHMALQYSDPTVSALLIEQGAGTETTTGEGWRPLHLAIFNDHPDTAELLMQKGVDVNARTPEAYTPMHMAVDKHLARVVDQLARRGADVNVVDSEGWSPLHLAAFRGYTDIVGLLLNSGADSERKLHDGRTPLMVAQLENHTETAQVIADFVQQH